jgi:hypothetical protein
MNPWLKGLLAAGALIWAAFSLYQKGEAAGKAASDADYAELLREAEDQVKAKEAAIEQIALTQLLADQQRQSTHQEIIRERTQIIDRPIYRNQCIDADGLRILDDIAANAHGQDPAAPDDRPAAASETAARD